MKRLMVILALAGCTAAQAQIETGDVTEESCGLAAAEALVGQDKAAVETLDFDGAIRVIAPGQAVTMDFNPARLNVDLDAAGKITRVWCG